MRTRRAMGFTLIELLVVIAIIALLVGVLLPALSAARRQAMLTQCLTQQRSLAQASINYTIEFKDFYPYHQRLNTGGFQYTVAGMWHTCHVARDPWPGAGNPISATVPEWTNHGNLYKPGVDMITTPETYYCPAAAQNVRLSRYIYGNYPEPWGSENLGPEYPGNSGFLRSSYIYMPYLDNEYFPIGGRLRRYRKAAETDGWVVLTIEYLPTHSSADLRGDTAPVLPGGKRVGGTSVYSQVDGSAHINELEHWFNTNNWTSFNCFKLENDLDQEDYCIPGL